jgi:AraC family transcriptional activator of pyochelin receptor
MTNRAPYADRMQAYSLMPGMHLHIADFKPPETIEQKFETTNPVLRFYFYTNVCGSWELQSPFRPGSKDRIFYSDQLSSVFFYPELEGKIHFPAECRQSHVSIYITPELLNNYLGDCFSNLPETLREIAEGRMDKGFYHSGPLPRIMDDTVGHLMACPYTGPARQLFLESKVVELMAHKVAQICLSDTTQPPRQTDLNPRDIERIRYARDILCRDLENPPRLQDLARSAGINHCKLNIGFRKIYGATVFGYLRRMRLLEAKRLIDQGDMNVTEVALSVGYNSLPSFSKAFTEFFGIPPMQCLKKRFRSFGSQANQN